MNGADVILDAMGQTPDEATQMLLNLVNARESLNLIVIR